MAQTESNPINGINPDELPYAQVNPKARFSLIWIIPITAALIGGWLIFKYYANEICSFKYRVVESFTGN